MVRMKEIEKKGAFFFFFSAFGSPSGKRLLWWCETKISISLEDLTVVKKCSMPDEAHRHTLSYQGVRQILGLRLSGVNRYWEYTLKLPRYEWKFPLWLIVAWLEQ